MCKSCAQIRNKERKKEWYEAHKVFGDRKKCEEPCCVCGGEFASHFDGKPYCNKHYQKVIRYGTPSGHPRESTNEFRVRGEALEIVTKKGDVIIADASDLELLRKYSWCISKTGYAVANINGRVTKMHRYILRDEISSSSVVDHINRNTLDNRRKNLRKCSQSENARNRGASKTNRLGILGVRVTPSGKYNARIVFEREEIYLGIFETLKEAIEARNRAEDIYHGDFGSHNGV